MACWGAIEAFYGVNYPCDHIDNEHDEDRNRKHPHDSRHDINVRHKPLRSMREMHAFKHQAKQKHYVYEIHYEDERIIELSSPELSWS